MTIRINTNALKAITQVVLFAGGLIFDISSLSDLLESADPGNAIAKALENGLIDETAAEALQQWAESEESKKR
ncbi:MAG: hypothetical protein EAZ74_05780 [Alphaproteobacteria bacterium]|nr:MAG: hypothetical protein EAY76_03760 [Alphaproteobacteria bacterium]TAF13400.1 MAG: hypothetical protein EAZ74_05780 [Alphaproteobacteria bacterium]TAF77216.1 MAG: hypothetical protein EAZ52_01390 [Alphaproteobacteria bacterium]